MKKTKLSLSVLCALGLMASSVSQARTATVTATKVQTAVQNISAVGGPGAAIVANSAALTEGLLTAAQSGRDIDSAINGLLRMAEIIKKGSVNEVGELDKSERMLGVATALQTISMIGQQSSSDFLRFVNGEFKKALNNVAGDSEIELDEPYMVVIRILENVQAGLQSGKALEAAFNEAVTSQTSSSTQEVVNLCGEKSVEGKVRN